jgi:sirohydrochlorin cobaltochelatase
MPLSRQPSQDSGLLIAAHGERRVGAVNEGVARLAADLMRRNLAEEIGIGFIKGMPRIDEALRAFASGSVLVYPLFLSDGYFNRVRLPQLLAKGSGWRNVRVLPPLGRDPALAGLVAEKAEVTLANAGYEASGATVVLLAHGTPSDPASHESAEAMAGRLRRDGRFLAVRCAFLDERPSLADSIADVRGPAAVVGLFAGEGLHGGADVPRLLGSLAHDRVVFAGNVGAFEGIADLVANAVARAATGHA